MGDPAFPLASTIKHSHRFVISARRRRPNLSCRSGMAEHRVVVRQVSRGAPRSPRMPIEPNETAEWMYVPGTFSRRV